MPNSANFKKINIKKYVGSKFLKKPWCCNSGKYGDSKDDVSTIALHQSTLMKG